MQERAVDLICLMINSCTLFWTVRGGFLKSGPPNSLSTNYGTTSAFYYCIMILLRGTNRESNPYIFPEDLECCANLHIYNNDQVQVCNYPTFGVSTVVLESGPVMQVSRELFAFVDVFGYKI
jgi:hypothetical protein